MAKIYYATKLENISEACSLDIASATMCFFQGIDLTKLRETIRYHCSRLELCIADWYSESLCFEDLEKILFPAFHWDNDREDEILNREISIDLYHNPCHYNFDFFVQRARTAGWQVTFKDSR